MCFHESRVGAEATPLHSCRRAREPQSSCEETAVLQEPTASVGGGGEIRKDAGGADSPPPRLQFSHNSCFFSAGKQIPKANSSELSRMAWPSLAWHGPARPRPRSGPAATTTRNKKKRKETNRSVSRERFFRVAAHRQETEGAGEEGGGEKGSLQRC